MHGIISVAIICVLINFSHSVGSNGTTYINDETTQKACDPAQHPVVVDDPGLVLRPLVNENGTYVHNQDCRWLVKAPEGSIVAMDFIYIDLEPIHPCESDNLILYDSNKPENNHKLVMFCGEMVAPTVHSSHINMLVVFNTGMDGTGTGFEANFTFIDVKVSACSSRSFVADSWVNGGFSSPGYGISAYPQSSNCVWKVTSLNQIRLEFLSFDVLPDDNPLSCPAHNVIVYDITGSSKQLIGTYCGNKTDKIGKLPGLLGATGEGLEVHLQSNTETGGSGFRARFLTENTTAVGCSDRKPSVIDWGPGIITSPQSDISRCSWRLITTESKIIKLTAVYFDLSNRSDCSLARLEIYDGDTHNSPLIGEYCGTGWEGEIVFSTNVGYIQYYSTLLQSHAGFQLKYVFYDVSEHACGEDRPIELTQSSGLILSPNYEQGDYPDHANCQWLLKAPFGWVIRFNVLDFHIENCDKCRCDFLQIYNGDSPVIPANHMGTYCGKIDPPSNIISTLPATYMTFLSDSFGTERGFKLNFVHQYLADVACGINKPAFMGYQPGDILSYGYERGEEYKPDSYCSWRIAAGTDQKISITLKDFSIELGEHCEYDFVKLFDGNDVQQPLIARICGRVEQRVFHSSGKYMYVLFMSNDNTQNRGFHLQYRFQDLEPDKQLGFLPGLLVVIVFLGVCILFAAYCHISDSFKKFKRWICGVFRRTNSSRNEGTSASSSTTSSSSTRTQDDVDTAGFVPAPVRRVITPPSNVDNMHYFAIADYAPPTYEEATGTPHQPEETMLEPSTNQNSRNTNSNNQSVNQNTEAASNQKQGNSLNVVPVTRPSTSQGHSTERELQVNTSALGNADMGMGILQRAGVYSGQNKQQIRRPSEQSYPARTRSQDQNTESVPSISMSSVTLSNVDYQNEHPNLTFTSSISNNALNCSSANTESAGNTTFTDVTADSNIFNPVYTALHNRAINASHSQQASHISSSLLTRSRSKEEVFDADDDAIYDTPKNSRSHDDSNIHEGHSNKAFMKEANISMDPCGTRKKPSSNGPSSPAKAIDIQNGENGAYMNIAFHRVNSTTVDTDI